MGKVVDFGGGDGRFALFGQFDEYVGYEIDPRLCSAAELPVNSRIANQCAFSAPLDNADLCIGNPPFVRNQDLPTGWRDRASKVIFKRLGVTVSGLANAWQYFFFLALATAKPDGVCALVVPYEWVSRPSSKAVRTYIERSGWDVAVYRLVDATFRSVLTTASITVIDKASKSGSWSYFEESSTGAYRPLSSPSGSADGVIPYMDRATALKASSFAKRGLSPGTQQVLTLTEGERVRQALRIGVDVVPCVTTLRDLPTGCTRLDDPTFRRYYRDLGRKCWLVRTHPQPSRRLIRYLDAVPVEARQTSTCLERVDWWRFAMPDVACLLVSMTFRTTFPKFVRNDVNAIAVGGVYGIYGLSEDELSAAMTQFMGLDIRDRVVAHSHGLRKIEIGQLNNLLGELLESRT
ncbi:MAG TPA: hypothetical protein VN959_02830 [Mycobacterium sp.]|nr:hypothetical protein [Mycobacterium sp.]